MSKLNGKYLRQYRNAKGTLVFVYTVSGSEEGLTDFKEAQGEDFYKEDEETGKPIWFTTDFAGKSISLIITSKGRVIADMSEYEASASLVKKFGGNFGEELAKASVANLLGGSAVTANQSVSRQEVAEDAAEPDGEV